MDREAWWATVTKESATTWLLNTTKVLVTWPSSIRVGVGNLHYPVQ